MAVISTENLLAAFVRKFSIGTNSVARFTEAFLSAYNDALFDLYNDGHIEEPTMLTLATEDSAIDERYLPQIKRGIQHFLQSEGEWVKGESRDNYSWNNWELAKNVWQEVATAEAEAAGTRTYPFGD